MIIHLVLPILQTSAILHSLLEGTISAETLFNVSSASLSILLTNTSHVGMS